MSGRGARYSRYRDDDDQVTKKRDADEDADTKCSRRLLFALQALFAVFVVVVLVLMLIHMYADHPPRVDPLASCDRTCPLANTPCEEWLPLVVDGVCRCMKSLSPSALCAQIQ